MERREAHLPDYADESHQLTTRKWRIAPPPLVPPMYCNQRRESKKGGVSYQHQHPRQKAESKADATFGIERHPNPHAR